MVSLERYFFPYWFSGFYNERFLTKFDLCRLSIVQPRGYDLKLSRRRTMKIASMLRLMDSSIDWKLWVGWHAWLKSTRFKHTERFGTFSFYWFLKNKNDINKIKNVREFLSRLQWEKSPNHRNSNINGQAIVIMVNQF